MDGSRLEIDDSYMPSAPTRSSSPVPGRQAETVTISVVAAAAPGFGPPLRLLLMGPPGSGKSTQAELLSERMELPHISVGRLLREEIDKGTPLGEELKKTVEAGDLAPSELVFEVLADRLEQPDCERGFVLDGYPREEEQLEPLSELLEAQSARTVGEGEFLAIGIDVPEQEIYRRLEQRGRADDTPETVAHRLEVYEQRTQPVIARFREEGAYVEIDGLGTPEQVARRIAEIVPA